MPDLSSHTPLALAVAFALAVIASARFTRLVVFDSWPPIAWLRDRWERVTTPGKWRELFTCPFCFAPYPTLIDLLLGWSSDLAWWWWLPNAWFAAAYLAAMIVVRDEPPE